MSHPVIRHLCTRCIYCLPLVPVPVVSLNSMSVIAGNTATFTCNITVSDLVDNNDLNDLSLASTSLTPSGTEDSMSQNGRVFTVKYTIFNVNTGDAGVYTCQSMVQHSDSNILISSTGSDTGTLSVQSEYILLVLYNLNNIIYNLIYRITWKELMMNLI